MRSMVRCAKCGKNPRSLPDRMRGDWQTLGMDQYDPRIVNAKISLAEHRNEHKKTDRSRRLSMTKMDTAVLPRRHKSIVVTVSLEDTDSDEERTSNDGDETSAKERETSPKTTSPEPHEQANRAIGKPRRASVWDRLTADADAMMRRHANLGV